jgi:hypothetical protein
MTIGPGSPAPAAPGRVRPPFWVLAAGLFLLLVGVYWATLLPGVGYHPDTARFQLAGKVLGIPHQTGFPTYVLLNKAWVELVPWGSVAWRANLLSAVLAAGACIVVMRLLLELGVRTAAAFAAALVLGLTRTLWSQAIVAEVYALNLLFLGLVLLFFLRWGRSGRWRDFALATAVYAVSFGNHLIMIWLLPAIAWWVWRCDRRAFVDPRKVGWVVLWVAVGASQYGYILWRAFDPATAFVEHRIPDFDRFLWFVRGGPSRGRMFAFSAGELVRERLPFVARLLWREWSVLLGLCALGVAALGRRPENRFLLLALAGPAVFAVCYDIPDVFVYFLPVHLVLAVYLGVGLGAVLDRLAARWPRTVRVAALPALAAIPAALLAVNGPMVDQSGNTARAEEIETALATAGRDSVLLAPTRSYSRLVYYYLLAEGWGSRNLHVTGSLDRALAYLQGAPLVLPEQNLREVPPGLPVFAIGPSRRAALEAAGLHPVEIHRRRTVLYLVAADARTAASALAASRAEARGALVDYRPKEARLALFEPDRLPPPERLARGPVSVECGIEEVAGRGAWKRPVPVRAGERFLGVRGWALDGGRPARGVWAVLDGRPFATVYGFHRNVGPAQEACRGCEASGFEALIPLEGLGAGSHRLGLWVLGRDGEELRPCARHVQLRMR